MQKYGKVYKVVKKHYKDRLKYKNSLSNLVLTLKNLEYYAADDHPIVTSYKNDVAKWINFGVG